MKITDPIHRVLCERNADMEREIARLRSQNDNLRSQVAYLTSAAGTSECEMCGGAGTVDDSASGWGPSAHTPYPCPDCHGTGIGLSLERTGEKP